MQGKVPPKRKKCPWMACPQDWYLLLVSVLSEKLLQANQKKKNSSCIVKYQRYFEHKWIVKSYISCFQMQRQKLLFGDYEVFNTELVWGTFTVGRYWFQGL